MTIDSGWAIFAVAALTFLATIVATIWKFSKSVDNVAQATSQMSKVVDAQWKKIDAHTNAIDDHQDRLTKVETTLQFIPGAVPK